MHSGPKLCKETIIRHNTGTSHLQTSAGARTATFGRRSEGSSDLGELHAATHYVRCPARGNRRLEVKEKVGNCKSKERVVCSL